MHNMLVGRGVPSVVTAWIAMESAEAISFRVLCPRFTFYHFFAHLVLFLGHFLSLISCIMFYHMPKCITQMDQHSQCQAQINYLLVYHLGIISTHMPHPKLGLNGNSNPAEPERKRWHMHPQDSFSLSYPMGLL